MDFSSEKVNDKQYLVRLIYQGQPKEFLAIVANDESELNGIVEAQIAFWDRGEANWQQSYADKRRREYPPIEEYMDGLVKGDQAQMQAYIDKCLAVKAKYPKQ